MKAVIRNLCAAWTAATLSVCCLAQDPVSSQSAPELTPVAAPSPSATASIPLDGGLAMPARRAAGSRVAASSAVAATRISDQGVDIRFPGTLPGDDSSSAVRIVLGLTLLAIVPALLVCVTAFLRIVIVLSMLRHAIGMPETPPNTVLIGLAVFLTLFTMSPTLQALNQDALQPFLQGKLGTQAALHEGRPAAA